ncbi:MAG: DNA mismatch repair endonuclease MutL [Clostridia bacterium]|nr:DNA mismatch repair endonuclease MutL [Clostridia bacterium]
MGIINILDFQVANLIAAGEVVERPASAVKELLENSIDAGASEITVEIKRGGIQYIRVSDNGCGMTADDLPVCIKRHATSKISCAGDLDGIRTLGFRGEALAAISSVSLMRIMTKTHDSPQGMYLECRNGEIIELSEIGCRDGTTVIVEELFSNVPARRKFLKRDQSEGMAVAAVVEKIALSRPDIAFKFISDGQVKYQTPGDSKVLSAVYSILGRDFSKKLIEVDSLLEGIEVTGYIGRPDNVKSNRNWQNFFLNGRYVRSKTITAALEQAFESYIETEKFPCCVLYIYIHPAFVDVNVHPTKLEVKFSDERAVFEAVYCAVRNALQQGTDRPSVQLQPSDVTPEQHSVYNSFVPVYDRLSGGASPEQKKLFDSFDIPVDPQKSSDSDKNTGFDAQAYFSDLPDFGSRSDKSEGADSFEPKTPEFNLNYSDFSSSDIPVETVENRDDGLNPAVPDERSLFDSPPYRVLGTAFHAYIFVEIEGKVLIVDKHAAHERILFEKLKSNMNAQSGNSQILLLPIVINLSPEEYDAADSFSDSIRSVGFDFTLGNSVMEIGMIPSQLDRESAQSMMEYLLGGLAGGTASVDSARNSFFEEALYQSSCKAAVKAGIIDSDENMEWIVKTLMGDPSIICCPHGRPVAIELSEREIERLFKRI